VGSNTEQKIRLVFRQPQLRSHLPWSYQTLIIALLFSATQPIYLTHHENRVPEIHVDPYNDPSQRDYAGAGGCWTSVAHSHHNATNG
jgi:hypothetical protein